MPDLLCPLIIAALLLLAVPVLAQDCPDGLEPDRVAQLATALPEQPTGLGRPIADRAFWSGLAKLDALVGTLRNAEAALTTPLPEQPDDLFLEFSRNGNRTNWQQVSGQRRARVVYLTLAECLENQGRFIPALEAAIEALCAERTWVMPAHDTSLANFRGTVVDIDLASSALGWNLSTADWLLGERLTPATRNLLRENLRARIFEPYQDMLWGRRSRNRWMTTTNNWNAVCLAGVTGAALAGIEDRYQRAIYAAAAESYSASFLQGFTPDGYCSEGLAYWNYGFGHFVLLSETLRQATSGLLDLLALPEAQAPARFGASIQIIGGVSPAFADCGITARPQQSLMWYLNRVCDLGLPEYDDLNPGGVLGTLFESLLYLSPNAASSRPAAGAASGPPLRTWFSDAGILISRPHPGSACTMGVALKGGHNAENHNHNDVGSYVVVLGDRPVLLDPGAEVYTRRTFSAQRYESKLLNSFGHPVPVVAGALQQTGARARAEVLQTDFSDARDLLQLDFASAYPVPDLRTLTRTFVYSREATGSLTVTDDVAFASPQTFSTALLTLGKWSRQDDGTLLIYDTDQAVRVSIDTGGLPYTLASEVILEDGAHPTRLAISLTEPVATASVKLTITPAADLGDDGSGGLLRNGGFELQDWAWQLPVDGLGEISADTPASGRFCLRIADPGPDQGSNVTSAAIPARGATPCVLSGKVRHVSGSGLGMYVRYYDAAGKMLNEVDGRGNMPSLATLSGEPGQWSDFRLPFTTPDGTASLRLWIHSYNASEVEAFLDDLRVEEGS